MILIDVRQPVEVAWEGPAGEDGQPDPQRRLPEGEWGYFSLRPLSSTEYSKLYSELSRPGAAEALVAAVGRCIKGWRNVKDANGVEIPFPGSGGKALEILPGDLAAWLGRRLVQLSQLTPTDRSK